MNMPVNERRTRELVLYLYSDSSILVSEREDVLVAGSLRKATCEDRRVLLEVRNHAGALQAVERLIRTYHQPL